MTQDEIVAMAIEARLAFDSEEYPEIWQTYMNVGKQEIEAFAKLVAAKEREALAQPEQEPVAWPCLIAEADFSQDTVTLTMQCTDYKVSAGKHWLSTTPPQRTWVGLTDEEIAQGCKESWVTEQAWQSAVWWAEDKLRNKNT
jgi:hypothetical protein